MDLQIILNGKKAALEPVCEAIYRARENGKDDVRVTWEAGDVSRLLQEACTEGCRRLVVGGGDGTVNEIGSAMMQIPADERPELAVLPLGTANVLPRLAAFLQSLLLRLDRPKPDSLMLLMRYKPMTNILSM